LHRPHPSLQANSSCAIATFSLCLNFEYTEGLTGMASRFARGSVSSRVLGTDCDQASRRRECNSPTVLTNPEPCRSKAMQTFSLPTRRHRAFNATGRI
jgi:hypothetical protein